MEVDSDEENNLIITEKKRRGLNELWIGLKFDKAFGWRWSQYKRRATFNVLAINSLDHGKQTKDC